MRARSDDPFVAPRTQPSIAVSADGERWSVINASPDIRDQFARFPGLHPRPGTRELPLDTVVLTNADLDHSLGLLILRASIVMLPGLAGLTEKFCRAREVIRTIWNRSE